MQGRTRQDITFGVEVDIMLKKCQCNGRLTRGIYLWR
ncbi:MAG: YwbE family protein [Desulfobacterales bacterium]|nr:YwbE family protein [Desulfobacterales bacterium]